MFGGQLSLCGQEPETALNSALASVKFFVQQKELSASLVHSKLQANMERVKEGCKRKLQVALGSFFIAESPWRDFGSNKPPKGINQEDNSLGQNAFECNRPSPMSAIGHPPYVYTVSHLMALLK